MTCTKSELLKRVLNRRSFAGLMDLYEVNHRLLLRLVPDLDQVHGPAVSHAPGSPDLHLQVEARCRFTTMLHLTYYFADGQGRPVADPDLQIRIYHDARQVEAVACRRPGPWWRGDHDALLAHKWDRNLFLEKWLRYTLGLGHRFPQGGGGAVAGSARISLATS